MPATVVPTLVCTDAGYLQHSAVCLASLLANNSALFFEIVIVRRATERLDEDKLRRSLAGFANHSLTFKIFSPPLDILLPLNPEANYTLDTWTRIWVSDFFGENVERVLYLDGDIVVVGSIAELWRVDLEGKVLGVVDIPGSEFGVQQLGLPAEVGYFNAGMMLFDLKQWRKTQVLNIIIDYIATNPAKLISTPDQDVLNACLYDRKKNLDPKWNAIWTFFQRRDAIPLSRAAIKAVRRDACIIHFNHYVKPWSYFCEHPRRGEYMKYIKLTEWRDFVPADRTAVNRLRKRLGAVLPTFVKRVLKALFLRVTGTPLAPAGFPRLPQR